MRSAQRASLLVALSLLTSAATASAEAWILWRQGTTIVREGERTATNQNWHVEEAVEQREDCTRALQIRLRGLMGRRQAEGHVFDATYRAPSTVVWTAEDGSGEIIHRLLCLPDTVDPRGPKGK